MAVEYQSRQITVFLTDGEIISFVGEHLEHLDPSKGLIGFFRRSEGTSLSDYDKNVFFNLDQVLHFSVEV